MHDIANSVVETIGWVRELGQFSRPARTGAIEHDGYFVAFLFTFGCQGKGIKDSSQRLFGTSLRVGQNDDGRFHDFSLFR
ncbi:hypothetical protein NITLEN_20054 [Nitrospira lenta]|uniref:Uncharacterized protein n=1 Tax=Nitrospira lenta TaxID=1436998 RepID=A0A330L600_9BACT|nr:hypothetical protein NITLEN_20054 [Nitrospira lenta]